MRRRPRARRPPPGHGGPGGGPSGGGAPRTVPVRRSPGLGDFVSPPCPYRGPRSPPCPGGTGCRRAPHGTTPSATPGWKAPPARTPGAPNPRPRPAADPPGRGPRGAARRRVALAPGTGGPVNTPRRPSPRRAHRPAPARTGGGADRLPGPARSGFGGARRGGGDTPRTGQLSRKQRGGTLSARRMGRKMPEVTLRNRARGSE